MSDSIAGKLKFSSLMLQDRQEIAVISRQHSEDRGRLEMSLEKTRHNIICSNISKLSVHV
jgi:hypothetical protein